MAGSNNTKKRAKEVVSLLKKTHPDADCTLNYRNPLELLIAVILSAQCTDERVNIVTKDLFKKYPSADDFAKAKSEELEGDIRSTGFFRNKAKSIQGASRLLVDNYMGEVPNTMEELLELPGVARKTANVVLGNAFQKAAGVVVDTHVFRLSHRLGFSEEKQPEKVEGDLMALIPRKDWIKFGHMMIFHGRRVCKAKKPLCLECVLNKACPTAFKFS
jgi:endonuclease-3